MQNRLGPIQKPIGSRSWTFAAGDLSKLANIKFTDDRKPGFQRYQSRAEIERIIEGNNLVSIRNLSHYFWTVSGQYRSLVKYYSFMLTYDYMVAPQLKKAKQKTNQMLDDYYLALDFVRQLKVKEKFPEIIFSMIKNGVYFGFLREGEEESWYVQDLPIDYCRSRFKTLQGINTVEIDMRMFDTVRDEIEKEEILKQYPKEIQKGYKDHLAGKLIDSWVMMPVEAGVCFYYPDMMPWFVSIIPELFSLGEYRKIELEKDKNEAAFVLTQKLPMTKENDLVFDLEETKEIHNAVVNMLRGLPAMHTLTTFADVDVHGLQQNRQAAKDNLVKAERTPLMDSGTSRELFAGEGAAALKSSMLMNQTNLFAILPLFNNWVSFQIGLKMGKKDYSFLFWMLPVTHYNRDEVVKQYLNNASYGYSKLLPAVAAGMAPDELLGTLYLENEVLGLNEKLIPLKSSHTDTGSDEGGRPAKKETDVSDKTIANENSTG